MGVPQKANPPWAGTRPAPTGAGALVSAPTLGDVVGAFKSLSTREYAKGVHSHGWPGFPGRLWQRNYYERVIRTEDELLEVRDYIVNNPLRWEKDEENPGWDRP